jgi:hypothetical protein
MHGDGVTPASLELRGDLPGGRRELRAQVGSFTVVVAEIPARSLNEREWSDIKRARTAYASMWGGQDPDVFTDDPLDGWDRPYRTWHYCAYVTEGGGPGKLVVMRKVTLSASELSAEQRARPDDLLPVDIRFWRVRTDGTSTPLWHALRRHARRVAPHERHPEFRIASISRSAASPLGEHRSARERDRTAIGFAAIQLLAAQGDPSLLYVCSLCPELRDRVMGLRDVRGAWVSPAFTRTEDVLGLPAGSVGLDNGLPLVQEHKTAFPGYFVHNDDAAQVISDLLDEGRISAEDLREPTMRLLARESARGADTRVIDELAALIAEPDHRRLADVLTRPRLFQYLVPLIAGSGRLSRMSAADLRARLLYETRDGPFSSTLVPAAWAASAWSVLDAAERKYRVPVERARPFAARRAWSTVPPHELPAAASGS